MAGNVSAKSRALALREAWERLTAEQRLAVFTRCGGQTVSGLEVEAYRAAAVWFYSNWAKAFAYAGAPETDLALDAANWLDRVSEAIGDAAANAKRAIHNELLFVAAIAVGVLVAYGYATRR